MKVSYAKLWKLLIDHDMKKSELKEAAQIGQATLTKLNKGENVSMEVLMKICKVLKCNIGDIVDFVECDFSTYGYTIKS